MSVELETLDVPMFLIGADGDDSINGSSTADETIAGLGGNDTLDGNDGADNISGGAGDDLIFADLGEDTFDGGEGNDTLDSTYTGADVEVDLTAGTITFAGVFTEIATNFESAATGGGNDVLIGNGEANTFISGEGNDGLSGGDGDDYLSGLGGADTLDGGAGNDTILADFGTDVFDGGDGIDTLDVSYTAAPSVFDLDAGTLTFDGVFSETATNFENAIGGAGANEFIGNAQANRFEGREGADIYTLAGGGDTIVLSTGDGQDTVSDFNFLEDVIEIDGVVAIPNALEVGVSFSQVGADVLISYGSGDTITLTNVDFMSWAGALTHPGNDISGTTGNDVINGTSDRDIISSAEGNDTIFASGGDDTIIYASGNDVIENGNTGSDTLNLSAFAAGDVSFRVSGHDVLVATPDGEIELDYQVRYEIGNAKSNIETILFSDGSLDEAGIKARALSDPSTPGDDTVYGTIQNDIITDGVGNDTIYGQNGDDTIIYASGNDVIENGNTGSDTLDLSQYAAADVSFRVVGHDVFITTPDGEIELDYQVRYEIGNAKSN
ncbi:MAG: calcium-binding protein, partial [Planctomycetaceae bacterium]|nr:calcium-binding protein [Planctomycetaceae bacterium]